MVLFTIFQNVIGTFVCQPVFRQWGAKLLGQLTWSAVISPLFPHSPSNVVVCVGLHVHFTLSQTSFFIATLFGGGRGEVHSMLHLNIWKVLRCERKFFHNRSKNFCPPLLVDLLWRDWSSLINWSPSFTRITFVCIEVFRKVFTLNFLHSVTGLISCIFKLFPNRRVICPCSFLF